MNNNANFISTNVQNQELGFGYKKLCLLAGVHGNELGSVIVANEIKQILRSPQANVITDKLPGFENINILCVANESGIKHNSAKPVKESDEENLNRGWVVQKETDESIRENILSKIKGTSVLIDIHCSHNMNSPFFLIDTDQIYAPVLIDWCKTYKLPFVVRDCDNTTIKKYAEKAFDSIALTWEQPGVSNSDTDIDDITEIMNLWINKIFPAIPMLVRMAEDYKRSGLAMLGSSTRYSRITKYKMKTVRTPLSGIYIPTGKMEINNDEPIGKIIHDDGSVSPIFVGGQTSEDKYNVFFDMGIRYCNENDTVAFVQSTSVYDEPNVIDELVELVKNLQKQQQEQTEQQSTDVEETPIPENIVDVEISDEEEGNGTE